MNSGSFLVLPRDYSLENNHTVHDSFSIRGREADGMNMSSSRARTKSPGISPESQSVSGPQRSPCWPEGKC